ncbi:MAG: hypothetical protein WD042_18385 [Phycisphaeraceae bacterium]
MTRCVISSVPSPACVFQHCSGRSCAAAAIIASYSAVSHCSSIGAGRHSMSQSSTWISMPDAFASGWAVWIARPSGDAKM